LATLSACTTYGPQSIDAPASPYAGPVLLDSAELQRLSSSHDFQRGVGDARANILVDNLELRSYGLIIERHSKSVYQRRLGKILASHGVQFVNPGCEFPPREEAIGYSHTIAAEILRRHGTDFWQRVDLQARAGPVSAP
jgi:hypothetical protein